MPKGNHHCACLWVDLPRLVAEKKAGCREEGRGSLDILPVLNLPTSKNQSRTNSQRNRETILTSRLHLLDSGVLFFFNPWPSLPKEPTRWFLSRGSVSAASIFTKLNFCNMRWAAWLPQWDPLTFQRAVDNVLYPRHLVFRGVNVRLPRLMGSVLFPACDCEESSVNDI